MPRLLITIAALGLVVALGCWLGQSSVHSAPAAEPMVAHMVYFSLKDKSDASKKKLVEACKTYLSKHPGTVYFAAGTLCEELNRPVNDREFDVSLHLVFKDKAAHDKYAVAETHLKFIEENKDNWTKVRVFDSNVTP